MKILVTGASGRIGLGLVQELTRQGESVHAFVLPQDPRSELVEATGARVVVGDLLEPESIKAALENVDAIYHLAAIIPVTEPEQVVWDINVRSTLNLLQAVSSSPIPLRRFVFASTGAVYPDSAPLYLPTDESHPRQTCSFYAMTKLLGEEMVWFYSRKYEIPTVVARFALTVRPHEILEPDSWAAWLYFLRARIRLLQARGDAESVEILSGLDRDEEQLLVSYHGDAGLPFEIAICDVRDIVQGLWLMLETGAAVGHTFNLGPAAPFTVDCMARYLSERTGIPYVEAHLPCSRVRMFNSVAKARCILGYAPQHTIYDIIDAALAETRSDRHC